MIETVKILYFFLQNNEKPKREFLLWRFNFVLIHGELDSQRKLDVYKLCSTYNVNWNDDDCVFKLIYCLETYYTIVLRILAFNAVFKNEIISLDIFNNKYFLKSNILNYNCNEYFNWFSNIEGFINQVQAISSDLKEYDNVSEIDFIKEIFESIFPSPVRHAMGEFYTPDWLSNFVIDTITKDDDLAYSKTYLDPTCGSGTFIFNVIKKFKNTSNNKIFKQVFGIDMNPVSVLAAKTNYLLLYIKSFECFEHEVLTIPIFYADVIQSKFDNKTLFDNESNTYENVNFSKVDYIVGNPPWVNWEYLPKSYKMNTAYLWQYYNLFNVKGISSGFIKEDISVLITYVVLDKFLKENGKLGFIVKETLFKSIKHGEGFRKFKIFPTNTDVNPYQVNDLTLFKPFKDAVNRTAIVFLSKGEKVKYPIDYVVWKPLNGKRTFEKDFDVKMLSNHFEFINKKAQPSDKLKLNSGWITTESKNIEKTNLILGKSAYLARTGTFTGGANGIFWLDVVEKKNDLLSIKNITARAKNKMKNVEMYLETDLIYPFLTGNDLEFWQYSYSKYTICPHTALSKMYPIDIKTLEKTPRTLDYFKLFKTELEERKGFTTFDKHIQIANYYAIQRIGEYTFAKYKVAWRYICKDFRPAVIEYANDKYLGVKNIIPNEKIIFVGLDDKNEAYYLCGLLSSSFYRKTIESYMVGTQITPSIIKRLKIPKFEFDNIKHIQISNLCLNGHFSDNKDFFVNEIDNLVEEMIIDFRYKALPYLL